MKPKKVLPVCILIFGLLMGFYLLTFSGMGVTDDEQLFAVLTGNMADGLGNSTLPLYGNDRIRGEAANTEPLHPFLGVPLYRMAASMDWGRVQALHIPAGIYTALTAALLAFITMRRGYSQKSAVFLALCFGLCTIALPYARTNFREPLAALCLTCTLVCVDNLRSKSSLKNTLINLADMLTFIGLAALTKLVCVLCLPFFIIAAWLNLKQRNDLPRRKLGIALTTGLLVCTLTMVVFLSSQSGTSNNRFSLAFIGDMLATLTRLPHGHFWQALAGMLISPGKGLLVYSPVLMLAFANLIPTRFPGSSIRCLSLSKAAAGFLRWLRQAQPTSQQPIDKHGIGAQPMIGDRIMAFGSLCALMVIQALLYDQDWWNITWSTRALLPALPLLMLACLPALDAGLNHGDKRDRMLVYGLAGLGFLIQIGRLLTSDPTYIGWLAHVTGEKVDTSQWWDLSLMPLWRHWALALQGIPGEIAWLHLEGPGQMYSLMLVSACLLLILACAYFLLRNKGSRLKSALLILLFTLSLIPAILTAVRNDSRYYGNVEEYRQSCSWISENSSAESLVLVDVYLKPLWWYSFNFGCSGREWAGLPYEHAKAYSRESYYPRLRELALLIEGKQAQGIEVYLLESTPPDPLSYQAEFERYGLSFRQVQRFVGIDSNGVSIHLLE